MSVWNHKSKRPASQERGVEWSRVLSRGLLSSDDAILMGGLSLLLNDPPAPELSEPVAEFAAVDKPVGQ